LSVPVSAYNVERRILHLGNIRESDGLLTVETSPKHSAYTVELPLDLDSVSDNQRLRIKLAICVDSGCIGFGVANRDGSAILEEIPVPETSGEWIEIELFTPQVSSIGSLIIRNASGNGIPSRSSCRIVDIVAFGGEIAPFRLSKRIVHFGNIRDANEALTVETSAKQWAYAVELPLDRDSVSDKQRLRVKLGVSVDSVCLGFGVTTPESLRARRLGVPCNYWASDLLFPTDSAPTYAPRPGPRRAHRLGRRPHSSLDGTTPDHASFPQLPLRMAA
jgi:hypothetical protein